MNRIAASRLKENPNMQSNEKEKYGHMQLLGTGGVVPTNSPTHSNRMNQPNRFVPELAERAAGSTAGVSGQAPQAQLWVIDCPGCRTIDFSNFNPAHFCHICGTKHSVAYRRNLINRRLEKQTESVREQAPRAPTGVNYCRNTYASEEYLGHDHRPPEVGAHNGSLDDRFLSAYLASDDGVMYDDSFVALDNTTAAASIARSSSAMTMASYKGKVNPVVRTNKDLLCSNGTQGSGCTSTSKSSVIRLDIGDLYDDGYCYLKFVTPATEFDLGRDPLVSTVLLNLAMMHPRQLSDARFVLFKRKNLVHVAMRTDGESLEAIIKTLNSWLKIENASTNLRIGSSAILSGRRQRPPRHIRNAISNSSWGLGPVKLQLLALVVSVAMEFGSDYVIKRYFTRMNNITYLQEEGLCHTLLVNTKVGRKPLVSDFIYACQGKEVRKGLVKVTFRKDVVHIVPDKNGVTPASVIIRLASGKVHTMDGEYDILPSTRIGAEEDEAIEEYREERNTNYSWLGTAATVFGALAVGHGVVLGALGTAHVMRPDWFGECYKVLVDIDLGVKPKLSTFLNHTTLWQVKDAKVSFSYSGNVVHVRYDDDGMSARDAYSQLAGHTIVVDNKWHTLTDDTLIGDESHLLKRMLLTAMLAAIAIPIAALVSVFKARPGLFEFITTDGIGDNGLDASYGKCYKCMADHDVGPNPYVVQWAKSVPDDAIKDVKVVFLGNANMIHASLHKNGLPARVAIEAMRNGTAVVGDRIIQLKPDTKIGGCSPTTLTTLILMNALIGYIALAKILMMTPLELIGSIFQTFVALVFVIITAMSFIDRCVKSMPTDEDGYCYTIICPRRIGRYPRAIEWAKTVTKAEIENTRIKFDGDAGCIHVREDTGGIEAPIAIEMLKSGTIKVDDKWVHLTCNTRIGGLKASIIWMPTMLGASYCSMFFLGIMTSGWPMAHATMYVLLTFVALWLVYVMSSGIPTKLSYKFITLGTDTGDGLAPTMYANQAQSAGIACSVGQVTPGSQGVQLVKAMEQRSFIYPLLKLATGTADVAEALGKKNQVVFASHVGKFVPGAIIYSVAAEKHLRQPMVFTGNASIDNKIDTFMAKADIIIESKFGCAGRTSNGKTLLKQRMNRGRRRTLIALGNSSLVEEPKGLDYSTTWSTNPNSWYRHEPRSDHNDIFADYVTVYHHGGAGTDRTARACGCESISLSQTLDRNHKPNVGEKMYYTRLYGWFWVWAFYAMSWETQAAAFDDMWKLTEWQLRPALVLIFLNSTVHYAFRLAIIVKLLLVTFTRAIWVQGLSVTALLTSLFVSVDGKGVGSVSRFIIRKSISHYIKNEGLSGTARRVFPATADAFRFSARFQSTITVISEITGYGWLTVVIMSKCILSVYMRVLVLSRNLSDFAAFATRGFDELSQTPTEGHIYLAIDPMHSDLFHDVLMMRHTYFLNGSTGMSVGITMADDLSVEVEHCVHKPAIGEKVVKLPIPIEDWDTIVSRLLSRKGTYYGPWNNCQTNTMAIVWDYTRLHTTSVIGLTIMCVYSFGLMTVLGLIFVFVAMLGTLTRDDRIMAIATKMMPRIAFAGSIVGDVNLQPYLNIVKHLPSLLDGCYVIDHPDKYPATELERGSLRPNTVRSMRLQLGSETGDYMFPCSGMNRPGYTVHRDEHSVHNLHNITDEGLATKITPRQRHFIATLQSRVKRMKLQGVVAVIATSVERPIAPELLEFAKSHCDDIVVLSTEPVPGFKTIDLPITGREIACFRVCMPRVRGCVWVSLNANFDGVAKNGLNKLQALLTEKRKMPYFVSAHGMNPGPAGAAVYESPIIDESAIDLAIYGAEEVAIAKHPGTVYVANSWVMCNVLRKELSFPCNRSIVLYNKKTLLDEWQTQVKNWSAADVVKALAEAEKPCCGIVCTDLSAPTNVMTPVVSEMYPAGVSIEEVMTDARVNVSSFGVKLDASIRSLVDVAKDYPMTEALARAYFKTTEIFSRDGRNTAKKLWAPVHKELNKLRAEELVTQINANPVFVQASFEDTLSHYIKHLNFHQHDKQKILSPTEYRRRVNRNPYVDTYLQKRLADAFERGVDASTIACREVQLESLARYNKGSFVDAMTDQDVQRITSTIYKRNPGLFADAVVADPGKLAKKFLSYKKYSAGLPFTYEHSGIKNRSDLRKAGWLRPMIEVGLLPYTSGKWYPAIAHSFPKSQVVNKKKIFDNPAKMRTIVATAGFNNVQQGILNFDLNNRHDYLGSNEKVAMPLLGSYMNYVFEDIEKYNFAYSIDVTSMDANLPDGVLQIVAELRKKGFDNHPAKDAICKHIDCAMEQTKHSYVINLIDAPAKSIPGDDPLVRRVKEWSVGKGEWAIKSDVAPGGVLKKDSGGSTGDTNVTFNNTKGMAIIVMYTFCKATGTPYEKFFDKVALHNFGDDDVMGTNFGPNVINKMVTIAQKDLGLVMRLESQGTHVLDQVFLGRKPVNPLKHQHEFERAGVPMPRFAILNDTETLTMRLASEKAEMTRHKGVRHELYRLEKAMGYALLTAHQPDLYDVVCDYFEDVKKRLPTHITSQPWFKKKYKLLGYDTVIRKWYRPLKPSDFSGVHGMQMEIRLLAKTEASFLSVCKMIGWVADNIPTHLVCPDQSANAYRVGELYTGIFEAHAWHNFVREAGKPPTITELTHALAKSPYSHLCNIPFWHRTVGATLPTQGPLFERNHAHATWMLIFYTTVYMQTNAFSFVLNKLPLGNVMTEVFNLHTYKSRKLFGFLGYVHYIASGANSPIIDGLVPNDPYAYHKRAAALIMNSCPKLPVLGYIPVHKLGPTVQECVKLFARTKTLTMASDGNLGMQYDRQPWEKAIEEAKEILMGGMTPLIVAHTGTGKTRDTPGLILADPQLKASQVIVVMPRVLICEQWSKVSGAIFKKRGVADKGPLMTCTYGYLNHCKSNDAVWWDQNAFWIFDEAHEESPDWFQLRKSFIKGNPRCLAMTATPAAATCTEFQIVNVDIPPKFRIVDVDRDDLESAIAEFVPHASRFLIIEPSLSKCKSIEQNMLATGYACKVVHAGDRHIPDVGNIIATSVVESSITIPGCDLVIDIGERYVNDGGTLIRVPNDVAGSIQRRGRTGRTCPGTYVRLKRPANDLYRPVPDINSVLAKSKAVESLGYHVPFDMAPRSRALNGDRYAIIDGSIPGDKHAISILQILLNAGKDWVEVHDLYAKIQRGHCTEVIDHLLISGVVSPDNLPSFEMAVEQYNKARICYKVDNKSVGNVVKIQSYKVTTRMVDCNWEARANSPSKQDTSTPRIGKNSRHRRRRPGKARREFG